MTTNSKFATIVNGVVDVISYYPDHDADGNILAPWVLVPDDVFAGFIDNGDGTFSAPEVDPSEYEEPDPVIITAAQARLTKAGDNIELVGGGMGGVAGAFAIAPGLAYVQFAKDQGTSDYVVNAFGTGLYRCYVPIEEQYTDGFMLVTTDLAGAPEFPDCVTVIVTRT